VSGFPVNFGDRCHLFPDDQNIQKGYPTVWLYLHSELDGRP
jgi:hypothetical protein